MTERNAQRLGFGERFVGAYDVGFTFNGALAAYEDADEVLERFRDQASCLITAGENAIIPGEAPLCTLVARHEGVEVDVAPIDDAFATTVKMAELSVELRRGSGFRPGRRGCFAGRSPRERGIELSEFHGIRPRVLGH